MKITVINRYELGRLDKVDPPAALISVRNSRARDFEDDDPFWMSSHNIHAHVHFCFDDVQRDDLASARPITEQDAMLIAALAHYWADRGCEHIICQCPAGLSRSAGMAAALAKYFNGDDTRYFKEYLPNMRVYRMVLNALYDTEGKEETIEADM